jgi:RND family efflux transporter MFP subunit
MSAFSWRPLPGLAVLAAVLAGGCGREQPAREARPVEVGATRAITGEVADYQDFTGRLSARKTVEVRARVSGYLAKALLGNDSGPIREGDPVRKGDLLFHIDPTVYEAAYEKAVADVAQYVAQKRLLDVQYQRDRSLVGRGIAQEDLDQTVALRDQAVANIAAARALVKSTKQNLEWTNVRAPLSGRVSRRLVDPGNLVKADDTLLTTIVTEDPIYVYFDVDERTLMDRVAAGASGPAGWLSGPPVPVLVALANKSEFKYAGTVDFVDNQVSGTTGTIRMRAVLPNPRGALKPGLFARVRLPLGPCHPAVLVSDEALQHDQGRQYVYVIDAKNEVVYRKVQTGQAVRGLREIKKGLAAGERVMVSGMLRVREGMEVRAKMRPAPAAPPPPFGGLLAANRNRQGDKETRRQGDKEHSRGGGPRRLHAGS